MVSGSVDDVIRLWDVKSGTTERILEGHTGYVSCVSFSSNGQILASKSVDGTVRIWSSTTWETVAILNEETSGGMWPRGLAFHPQVNVLATLGEKDKVIRIWKLSQKSLIQTTKLIPSVHYTNAKIVLVGDTGVGKSGLGLVLSGQPFQPTESTHGRHIWTLNSHQVISENGRTETRETLLWDLTGQPGYRLIHQLHLTEVAIALVVFDARSEIDPFAGVRHWNRALDHAQHFKNDNSQPLKKFLVSARSDRGGIGVSANRIQAMIEQLGFNSYFETSAKEGWHIPELSKAITEAIEWDVLPKVSSTMLFQKIKGFLLAEKEAKRVLSTEEDLYRTFLKIREVKDKESESESIEDSAELKAQFKTCIGQVEARGLIRRLSFGNLVLLQPELLDAYASAMINTARDEPDGLESLSEEDARIGRFRMSGDERLPNKEQEQLLLIATIEDLLRHEIALREQTEAGPILVFPSQFTKENPEPPKLTGNSRVFVFEGPIQNIYSTLVVRLSRSGFFQKHRLWQNVATFSAEVTKADKGMCGVFLQTLDEGKGKLSLFFDEKTNADTRFQFETYIHTHLKRRSLPKTIEMRSILACDKCGEPFTDSQTQNRRERGFDWIRCNVCDSKVDLLEKAPTVRSVTPEMDHSADTKRDLDTALSILKGKIATNDFDVYLCYNARDRKEVAMISSELKKQAILPWDKQRLDVVQSEALRLDMGRIKSVTVFLSKSSVPWYENETTLILKRFASRHIPIIITILPDCEEIPRFPEGIPWVDMRKHKVSSIIHLASIISDAKNAASAQRNDFSDQKVAKKLHTSQLRHILNDYFDLSELQDMVFDLNIDFEGLPGKTKSDYVRELIKSCERHNRISELIRMCFWQRPSAPW